jgi:hypothetical protein
MFYDVKSSTKWHVLTSNTIVVTAHLVNCIWCPIRCQVNCQLEPGTNDMITIAFNIALAEVEKFNLAGG